MLGLAGLLIPATPAHAAAGINKTLNFQGRLLTSGGAVVADGNYNFRMKIYQDGPGNVAGDTGGTLLWTELWQNTVATGSTSAVVVKNGYFSLNLGSYCAFSGGACQGITNTVIDFNQDTLWLSMDVGGTAVSNTPTYDGELVPMRRLASAVYALQAQNSNTLGGLSSGQYLQLAQGVQADASTTNASIFVNKTGITANVLDIQRGGADVLLINNAGQSLFRPTTDSQTALQVQKAGTTTTAFTVDSSNSRIGIGLNNPSYAVDAVGSVNASVSVKIAGVDVCTASGCTVGSGSGSYIQNQNASQQTSSNFWISGTGRADTSLLTPTIDTPSGTTTLAVGTTNATGGINLNQNTTIASGKTLSVSGSFTASGANLNTIGVLSAGAYIQTSNAAIPGIKIDAGGGNGITLGYGSGDVEIYGGPINLQSSTILTPGAVSNAFQIERSTGYNGPLVFSVDTSANKTTFGNVTTTSGKNVAGTLVLADGTLDGFGATLNTTTLTASRTITLPDSAGTVCLSSGNCSAAGGYIVNGSSLQASSNFNISGTGTAASSLLTPVIDAPSSGVLTIGAGATSTSVAIGTATTPTGLTANALTFNTPTISTNATTLGLFNTTPTTVTAFGAASTISVGAGSGTLSIQNPTLIVGSSGPSTFAGAGNAGVGFISAAYVSPSSSSGTVLVSSGNVSGVTSNTGAISVKSGDSSTSGNTGQLNLLSGNATGGNSGNLVVDAGAASGTRGTVTVAGTNASAVTIGNTTSNILTTINGTALVKTTAGNDSATAFQVQNAASVTALNVDTTTNITTTKDLNTGSPSALYGPGRLFSDGFESGNVSQWSLGPTVTGGSVLSTDFTTFRNGKYSQKFAINTGGGGTISTAIGNGGSSTYALRGYVYIASQTTGNADLLTLNNGTSVITAYRNAAGYLSVYNGPNGGASITGSTIMTTGAWHKVEMVVVIGSGVSGSINLFLENVNVSSTAATNTGTVSPTSIRIGDSNSGRTSVFYIDDVVADQLATGDSASLFVSDSFHVQGTSSFGGNVLVQPAYNSTQAFQVQNATGNAILTLDTSGGIATLGKASALTGQLTIANTTAFTSTISGNNSATASYTTILPPAVGVAGQCLSLATVVTTVQTLGYGACSGGGGGATVTLNNLTTTAINTDLTFANGANRAVTIAQAGAGVGNNLSVSAGQSGTGANNGGNLVLQAGATGGTGTTGSVIVKANGTDSTTAFALQNAAGTTVLNANTINGRISVGNVGTATGQLYVSGITPVLVGISLTTGGSPTAIYVQGHFAYETNVTTNTLKIYDVSNPAAPLAIGSVATGISPNFVFVQGRYAYVANYGADSMSIYDVSNPFAPTSVGSVVAAGTGPISIYVQGRYAYVANNISNTLGIYDISNPAAPLSTGSVSTGASSTPNSVYVQGKYAYVANQGTNALGIYDISNPAAPTSVGSVSTGASSNPTSVYVQGRYAYVANQTSNFLSIYDVKNPALPVSVGSITTGASSGPYSVYVQGRFAYVANYASSAISVYDVSSPATPASVASVTTIGTGPRSIYVQGRYAYLVTLTSAKMEVYDVGGTYTQQLEAGGIETGSLAIINSLAVGGSASFSGGINVSQSASINGNLSSAGNVLFQTRVNSTQAFQIQSTNATALLTADTTNTQVIVGNATVDATQINLQLDSSNVFADSGSCTTSANQGALYYNTASSEIRSCTAAGWSGIATVSGLGLVTYGVVENSGLNPGDLASTTTPGASGPCKVSWASTTTVSVAPCTAYSASRKVVVPSAVTLTLTTTIFSPYQTVCLNGTNGAPALSAIGASVSDPLIQPTFSTSAPIACLAVLQNNGSTAGVIGQIYDVRTFVSTVKEFATASTSIGPGMLAQVSGANIIPSNAATAGNQRGVVIASNGNTSSTTPNAIVAVGGSAFADADAGTAGQIMRSGIVTGYAETQANFLNSNATFTGSSQYTWIGQSRTTFANTCTSAATCIGSLYFTLTIH